MTKSKIPKKKETLREFIGFRIFFVLTVSIILCFALSILSFFFNMIVVEGIYGICGSTAEDMPMVFFALGIILAIIWLVWLTIDVGNKK